MPRTVVMPSFLCDISLNDLGHGGAGGDLRESVAAMHQVLHRARGADQACRTGWRSAKCCGVKPLRA